MCNLWAALLHQPPIVGWYILAFNLLAAAFIIFFEKREPEKTIAWLVVLFALPGLGFLAYLLLGRDWRKRKFRKKRVHDRSQADVSPGRLNYEGCVRNGLRPEQQQLLRMGDSGGCLSTSCDNQVQVFTNGQQKFAALLEDLRSARHHIHLEYFIWQRDDIGREVERVLAEKVQEGIEVRLLLDGFGCWRIGRRDLAEWQA